MRAKLCQINSRTPGVLLLEDFVCRRAQSGSNIGTRSVLEAMPPSSPHLPVRLAVKDPTPLSSEASIESGTSELPNPTEGSRDRGSSPERFHVFQVRVHPRHPHVITFLTSAPLLAHNQTLPQAVSTLCDHTTNLLVDTFAPKGLPRGAICVWDIHAPLFRICMPFVH